jgi:uncharacterized membrane protein YqjE
MAYRAKHESPRTQKPLSALFGDLFHEVTELVRGEVQLAKAELSEKVSQAESGAISFIGAYVLTFIGLLILLEAAVIGLAIIVEPWLSALIIGAAVMFIGLILASVARSNLKAHNMAPQATMESLRKDKQLLKEQMP